MHHRSWFPVILVGLSLALFILIAVTVKRDDGSSLLSLPAPRPLPPVAPAVTEDEYQTAVDKILADYAVTQRAKVAYDALIALTVPASKLQYHLDLVISFGKLAM